ncbi:unnamed protein product [Penicillium pancosmium]
MATPVPLRRFALLVGVDLYLNGGVRQCVGGKIPDIPNLRGCVNDVQEIKKFLQNEFQLHELHVLTSSLHSSGLKEPACRLPTISEEARAGDLFYFHFSGHGARLQPTIKSPPGRSADPSLLTMDFGYGRPALRGWQLNEWLKLLSEKQVHVVVTLDSCYSGGSWRADSLYRTPGRWNNILNTPADEEAITETTTESTSRDGDLEESWSLNPKGFTLMAACTQHELASELIFNGKHYGAFTHGLLTSLRHSISAKEVITYRALRDRIGLLLTEQTPLVFGRDRLTFFGQKERFVAPPLIAILKGTNVNIPIGKAHGTRVGSTFTTYPPTQYNTFSPYDIGLFDCTAKVQPAQAQNIQHFDNRIVPYRWKLDEDAPQLIVQSSLGDKFKKALRATLGLQVFGDIRILELDDSFDSGDEYFRLKKREDKSFEIFAPRNLIGYDGPVHGLDLQGDDSELAAKCGMALAHLARFSQILGLRDQASKDIAPFELTIQPDYVGRAFPSGQQFEFSLKNRSANACLYVTTFILSPAFHVRQLFPSYDSPSRVNPCDAPLSFNFRLEMPDGLQKLKKSHRDIVRTIVTTGQRVSWKSLELPDIWDADRLEYMRPETNLTRDGDVLCSGPTWWVKDKEIWTEVQPK